MSEDPNDIIRSLTLSSQAGANHTLVPHEIDWILATLTHQEKQIAELRKLATPAAPAGETICQEADRIVSHDRQQAYGHPAQDFMRTGAMWEAILGAPIGSIGPEQVALCMIAVKISRECNKSKRDNRVDICGYSKCLDLIAEWRAKQPAA